MWDAEEEGVKRSLGLRVGENEAPVLGTEIFLEKGRQKKMYLEPGTPNFPN